MKILVGYSKDCGRMGWVEGLFICEETDLDKITNKTIYFGEILGKHSNVRIKFDREDFSIATDDQEFIQKLKDIIKSETISGYNPLNYCEEEC